MTPVIPNELKRRWWKLLPAIFGMTLLSYVVVPFAVLFERNGFLPGWLRWFQTYDHDLYGGGDWQRDHPKLYKTRIGMILWLWRNPVGTFSYTYAGLWPEGDVARGGDPLTENRPIGHSGHCLTVCDNAFMSNTVRQYGDSKRCNRFVWGWKLYYEQQGGVVRKKTDYKVKPAQWIFVWWPLSGYSVSNPTGVDEQ